MAPILLIFPRIKKITNVQAVIDGVKCTVAHPTKSLGGPTTHRVAHAAAPPDGRIAAFCMLSAYEASARRLCSSV